MAVSDQQKIDFLLKKIGFTKTKTGSTVGTGAISGTPKQPFAEALPSPLVVPNSSLWNEADSIPATPPGSDTNQVKVYATASAVRMTADATSSGQRAYIAYSTYNDTSSTRLTNWIDTQFGALYLIKVFRGDPNSGGVALSSGATNENWFFDYSAGVLNFNDSNVPSGVTDTNIYIVGYRYIGQTGAPTSGISTFSYLDLAVERNLDVGVQGGISTFRNNIDLNADLDVDGHTNLDNVSVAGVSTFTGNIIANGNIGIGTDIPGAPLHISGPDAASAKIKIEDNNNGFTASEFVVQNGGRDLRISSPQDIIFSKLTSGSSLLYLENGNAVGIGTDNPSATLDVFGNTKLRNDLDVDGHTNLDNVSVAGFTTITQDLNVDGHTNLDNVSVAGVTTFNANVKFDGANAGRDITFERSQNSLVFADDALAKFGNSEDFKLFHDGSNSYIRETGTGSLVLQSNETKIVNSGNNETIAKFNENSSVELYHDSDFKFETTSSGVNVSGTTTTTGLAVSGVSTFTGAIDANGDLDVDGHTNLDNVSIAGVVTATTFVGDGDFFDLDVDGHTNLDNVNVVGVATFTGSKFDIQSTGESFVTRTGGGASSIVFVVSGNQGGQPLISLRNGGTGIGDIRKIGTNGIRFRSDTLALRSFSGDEKYLEAVKNGAVELYYDNVKRFSTSGIGATVYGQLDTTDLDVDGHTNLDNVSIAGVTTFAGAIDLNADLDVDGHTNLDNISVSGVSTFAGDATFNGNVSIGGTLTYEDVKNVDSVGLMTARSGINVTGGVITALAAENKIPSLYSAMSNLPNAGTYHGMFAHVHATARGYFAHAGNWMELVNKEVNGVVGTGTETYNIGNLVSTSSTATSLNVSGVTTTVTLDVNGDLDVDGHTNLDNLSVAGVTTFTGAIDLNSDLDVSGTIKGYDYLVAPHGGTTTITVTVASKTSAHRYNGTGSGDGFVFDGLQAPFITLTPGRTYKFDQSDNSNSSHPIRFYLNADRSIDYTDGVTTNGTPGSSGAYTQIVVTDKTPTVLHYQCQNHSYMGNAAQLNSSAVVTTDDAQIYGNLCVKNSGISTFTGQTNVENGFSVSGVSTFSDSIQVADSIIHQGDTDTKIDFANNQLKLTAGNRLRVDLSANHFNYFWGSNLSEASSTYPKAGSATYVHRFRDTSGDDTIIHFHNTNLKNTVFEWNAYGNTSAAGNLIFRDLNTGKTEYARFTGTGSFNIAKDLDVDGHTNLDNVSIAGFTTITQDLDVDGHTNLDNVSVAGVTTFSDNLRIIDGKKIQLGTSQDLEIYHSSNNSVVKNKTGNLTFMTTDSGEFAARFIQHGAVELYHDHVKRFETSSVGVSIPQDLDVDGHTNLDNVSIAGFTTITQDLDVDGHTNLDNVSVAGVTTFSSNTIFPDGVSAKFGTDLDGEVKHTGSNLQIQETTGNIQITNYANDKDVVISSDDGSGGTANYFVADGSTGKANLYYYGGLKLETNVTGVRFYGHSQPTVNNAYDLGASSLNWRTVYAKTGDFSGDLDVDGHTNLDNLSVAGVSTFADAAIFSNTVTHNSTTTLNDDVTFTGASYNALWDKSDNALEFNDNTKATFGTDVDLSIYHDGSNSYIVEGGTGSLYIRGADVEIQTVGGNKYFTGASNVAKLYHTNNEKLATTSTGINVTGLTDTDTLTTGNATFTGTIIAGGSSGSNGQYLKSTGTGVAWENYPSARTSQSFTASSGQTTFSFSYNVGYLDVFVNGVKLSSSEFTATNGTSVVLSVGSFVGDIVELFSYNTIVSGGGGGGISNVVEDTTPQLGGNLELLNNSITGTGNINITGIITATNFVGDGSGLTGITASGSGVVIKNSGSTVGTAGTINFGDNLSVSPASAGIVTVTAGIDTSQFNVNKLDVSGISTFKGNIDVNADLDVDGHTNLDNISVAGVSTFTGTLNANQLKFSDSNGSSTNIALFGDSNDLKIYHNGSHSIVQETGSGGLLLLGSVVEIGVPSGSEKYFRAVQNGAAELYHNNVKRLETTSVGVSIPQDLHVDGHTELDNVNIAGVVTATTFKGALQGTSGTFSSNVDITGDLDVNGHTDLDNVSIAGVVTATNFVGALTGNVTGNVSGSSGSATGNAATATALQNARTIGGVSFDGTANINLPGVNAAGSQDTSGNAATATEATNFTVTANNTTNETVYPVFVDGATGTQGAETDAGLTYNPSTGNLTATKFTGDGSGLTGITASGSGIVIKHDGSTVGTAGTINFGTNLDVSAISGGAVTITASGGGSGISTISGVVNIANDLDVDGHTNLDNVNVAGIVTVTNTSSGIGLKLVDASNKQFMAGGGGGGTPFVGSFTGHDFRIQVGGIQNAIFKYAAGATGNLELGPSSGIGITFNGSTGNAGYAGIITATKFVGDGSSLTGLAPKVGITTNLSGTFTASAGSAATINTFGYGSGDLVVEYTIYIKNGSNFQTQKLLAMRDGTTIHSTQFAVMFSSSLLVQCDATISGGNILLRATPETGVSGSTTYKVKREVM